jgi:hypothetical protein
MAAICRITSYLCYGLQNLYIEWGTFSEQESTSWYGQPPSAAQLEEALSVGHAGLLDCDKLETAKLHMDESSPSYRHQMAVRTSLEAKKLARAGYVLDLAAKHLAER